MAVAAGGASRDRWALGSDLGPALCFALLAGFRGCKANRARLGRGGPAAQEREAASEARSETAAAQALRPNRRGELVPGPCPVCWRKVWRRDSASTFFPFDVSHLQGRPLLGSSLKESRCIFLFLLHMHILSFYCIFFTLNSLNRIHTTWILA